MSTPSRKPSPASEPQASPLPDAFTLAFRRIPGGWAVSLGGKVLAFGPDTFGPLGAFVAACKALASGGGQ